MTQMAVSADQHTAELQYDVTKCFEQVQHGQLIQAAQRLNYPLVLLRVNLHSYRSRRLMLWTFNMVVTDLYCSRTVVAGSWGCYI